MADPITSPDGNWMWTGSEWIPTPPNSETEVPVAALRKRKRSLNQKRLRKKKIHSQSNPYHISGDNNSKYKVAGIFLSILSFFFPYVGSNSPFSVQFQGSEPFLLEIQFESIRSELDFFILMFTWLWALFLPYMIIIISSFVTIKIFFGHEDSPRTAGFVQISLSLLLILGIIMSSIYPEGYRLEDIGLGYVLGLTSGILLFIKGRFCPIVEE